MSLEQTIDTAIAHPLYEAIRSYRTELGRQKQNRQIAPFQRNELTVVREEQLRLIKEAYEAMLWETYASRVLRSYGETSYTPGTYLDLRI
jgi:hypothetical protein